MYKFVVAVLLLLCGFGAIYIPILMLKWSSASQMCGAKRFAATALAFTIMAFLAGVTIVGVSVLAEKTTFFQPWF